MYLSVQSKSNLPKGLANLLQCAKSAIPKCVAQRSTGWGGAALAGLLGATPAFLLVEKRLGDVSLVL